MFSVDADRSKRLFVISFAGHVTEDEVKQAARRVREIVKDAALGFRVLADYRWLDSMDPSAARYVGEIMDAVAAKQVASVVRVIPDPHKDIGLNILSRFHYGPEFRALTFETLADALQSLNEQIDEAVALQEIGSSKSNGCEPSPKLFFDTISAYQRTAAIKAAIELDFFTALGAAPATAAEIAQRCDASERGARILADYLTILGFLTKQADRYTLTSDSALFLDRKSPAYVGGTAQFRLAPQLTRAFDDLAGAVRKGGTAQSELGTIAPEHPVWIEFARSMGPVMAPLASILADLIAFELRLTKVLDVSASHGTWGIAFAKKNPGAAVVALDWAPVLEVARENAQRAGVADRFSTIAGSAFEVDLGSDYDLVLIPNFLHHFNIEDCVRFLKKVHAALRDDGRVAIAEFVPNPDRVTPPEAAGFSLVMLATTPEGDAYTLVEFEQMLTRSGFKSPKSYPLPPVATAIIAWK